MDSQRVTAVRSGGAGVEWQLLRTTAPSVIAVASSPVGGEPARRRPRRRANYTFHLPFGR
jgi:hypothetical protein